MNINSSIVNNKQKGGFMKKLDLYTAQTNLYNSKVKDLDKNLKALLRSEKECALAKKIDDSLER